MRNKAGAENPREQALASLVSIERNGRYPNIEVDVSLRGNGMEDADRGLYTRLVYGVTEKKITLDWLISKYSKTPVGELDADVLAALRLGVYQLSFMDRIPAYSAVDETVSLVEKNRRGYVNAVLRSYIRGGMKTALVKLGLFDWLKMVINSFITIMKTLRIR